jgi:hypothetical protein
LKKKKVFSKTTSFLNIYPRSKKMLSKTAHIRLLADCYAPPAFALFFIKQLNTR